VIFMASFFEYTWLFHCRGDLQHLMGKKDQTQGHLDKKIHEKQRDLQTAAKECTS